MGRTLNRGLVVSCALGLAACAGGRDDGNPFTNPAGHATAPGGDGSLDDDGGTFDDDGGDADPTFGDTDGPSNDDGADGPGDGGGVPNTDPPNPPSGLCFQAAPAGAPQPPAPKAYSGGSCPEIGAGYNTGFQSAGLTREFNLVVPSDYDPSREYPLVFAWYHITGDAMSFVEYIDTQALADEKQMIFVVPQDSGMFQATWPMTPLDAGQAGVDLTFFDDLLSCISAQFSVNPFCVSTAGVSSGGLWTALLGQRRGQYLASNLLFSGGYPTEFGEYWWDWQKSPHRFATLVLWGGPNDTLGINFNNASLNYISHVTSDGHFVLRCEHDQGHGAPPIEGDQEDPVRAIFDFVLNHPYWYEGTSIYQTDGLPPNAPDYCELP